MYSFTGSTKNTPRISLGGKKEKLGSAGIKDVYKNAIRERERRENERQRNKAASVIQAQYRRAVERRAFYVLQEKGLESEILEYESTKENGSNYKLQYHYLEVLLKSSVVFRGIRTKQDNMLLRRVLKMIEEREFGNIEAVNADSDFNPSKNSENEYIGNKIYKIHLLAGVLKVFLRKMTKGDAGFDNYQILDSQERAETLLNILKVIIRLGSQECQFYSDLNATEGYLWSLGQLLEQYYLNKDEICVNVLGLVSYLIIKAFEDADGTENDPEQSKNTIKYIVGGIVTKVGGLAVKLARVRPGFVYLIGPLQIRVQNAVLEIAAKERAWWAILKKIIEIEKVGRNLQNDREATGLNVLSNIAGFIIPRIKLENGGNEGWMGLYLEATDLWIDNLKSIANKDTHKQYKMVKGIFEQEMIERILSIIVTDTVSESYKFKVINYIVKLMLRSKETVERTIRMIILDSAKGEEILEEMWSIVKDEELVVNLSEERVNADKYSTDVFQSGLLFSKNTFEKNGSIEMNRDKWGVLELLMKLVFEKVNRTTCYEFLDLIGHNNGKSIGPEILLSVDGMRRLGRVARNIGFIIVWRGIDKIKVEGSNFARLKKISVALAYKLFLLDEKTKWTGTKHAWVIGGYQQLSIGGYSSKIVNDQEFTNYLSTLEHTLAKKNKDAMDIDDDDDDDGEYDSDNSNEESGEKKDGSITDTERREGSRNGSMGTSGSGFANGANSVGSNVHSFNLGSGKSLSTINNRIQVLMEMPFVIPLNERVTIFNALIGKDMGRIRTLIYEFYINQHRGSSMFLHSSMHLDQGVALTVRRDKVFYDGFNVLSPILLGNAQSTDNEHNENYHYSSMINHLSPGDGFKLDFKINFIDAHGFNEPGIDGGGVYREFMESTQDYIFDIKNNLFSLTENTESITDVGGNSVEKQQQYRLHPTEFVNGSEGGREERCQMLRYSGAIVAKTLVNYRLVKLPLRFSDFFLKRWLGLSFGLEDLAEYDYELYKGLVELYTKSKDKASQVDLLYGLDFTVSADKSFVYDLDTLGLKKHSTELENLNFNVINYDGGSKGKYGVDFLLVKLTRENFNNFKQVTNESVEYYIHQMVSFKLNNLNFSESQMAFLDGVFSITPFSFYRALFASPNELNTFLTGMTNYSEGMELLNGSSCYSSIDIADWKANTVYSGLFDQPQPNNYFGAFTADSERAKGKVEEDRKKHLKTIEMFWDIVENSLQDNEKRLLLKFVTSSELPPQGGFSNLNPKFCIQGIPLTTEQSPNVSGPDHNPSSSPGSSSTNQLEAGSFEYEFKCGRLPSSSTCVNLLKLPVYSNRAVLKEKLLYAINSKSGFLLS